MIHTDRCGLLVCAAVTKHLKLGDLQKNLSLFWGGWRDSKKTPVSHLVRVSSLQTVASRHS